MVCSNKKRIKQYFLKRNGKSLREERQKKS